MDEIDDPLGSGVLYVGGIPCDCSRINTAWISINSNS
jgi:hypothetical protein